MCSVTCKNHGHQCTKILQSGSKGLGIEMTEVNRNTLLTSVFYRIQLGEPFPSRQPTPVTSVVKLRAILVSTHFCLPCFYLCLPFEMHVECQIAEQTALRTDGRAAVIYRALHGDMQR